MTGFRFLYQARLADPRDVPTGTDAHDGDTIRLEVDRGFTDRSVLDLRLSLTFAPELSQAGGDDVRRFAQQWLEACASPVAVGAAPTPWPFVVETLRTRTEREVVTFGRYVADVYPASVGWQTYNRSYTLNAAVVAYVKAQGYGGGTGG